MALPGDRPFFDSTSSQNDPAALRKRMGEDGYLFVRNLAPADQLTELRRAILKVLADAGWVDASQDPMAGIWSGVGPFTEGDAEYMAAYKQIVNLPQFKTFADNSSYLQTIGKLLDGEVMAHRLRIGRVTFPHNVAQTTAAHQDFQYIRGTSETFTIWTPIGDCPRDLGGLAVLAGSHRAGFIEHSFNPLKKYAGHGLSDEQLSERGEWHTGDFSAGDVLIFHSYTIHKAMPNLTRDRLRLSTDNRYQRVGEAVSPVAQGTHYGL